MGGLVQRIDAYQREHQRLGFLVAVFKKFSDDRGGYLAALVAYYGFFSLFPLLLAFVTVLGFVVGNNPELQQKIVSSALAQFPVIGNQIRKDVHSIHGSGIALAIGIGGALWGGMGVVQAVQNAMNTVWNVPVRKKPNFVKARIKAVVMLAVLGVATIVAAALSGIAAGGGALSPILKLLALAGSVAVNFGVFLVAFRVLTTEEVSWGVVAPGALVAAVAWGALQTLGNYVVGHQLRNASQTYGAFALVIGLLSWLYLGAQVTILAAEINVVRARRLWPRSLQAPLGRAEKRALRGLAKQEERRPEEHVEVQFDPVAAGSSAHASGQQGEAEQTQAAATTQEGGAGSAAASVPGFTAPQDTGTSAGGWAGTSAVPGAAGSGTSAWNGRLPGSGTGFASDVPDALREVAREAQTLVRQELQLAKLEMGTKARSAGLGAGLFGAAGMVGVLATLALVAAIVLGLATVLPGWAAGLVGAALVAAVAGILALRGRRATRQATPLVPEQAIGMLTSTRDLLTRAWQSGTGMAEGATQDPRSLRHGMTPVEPPPIEPPGPEPRHDVPGGRQPQGEDLAQSKQRGTEPAREAKAPTPEPEPAAGTPPPPARQSYKLPEFPRF